MRTSSSEALERIARRIPIPEPAYERMLYRRDRKLRNQRIAAGSVGITVFVAAVLVVTSIGWLDRNPPPPATVGTGMGPTAPGSMVPPDVGWDGVGLPPEEAVPSTPEVGEVVAQFAEFHVGFVFVYADGRVLWTQGQMGPPSGTDAIINERRLSPEGVDLVRSGALQPEDLLGPVYEVPASAWADREARPYVPSRYAVCYHRRSGEAIPTTVNQGYEYPSTVLPFFPVEARTILSGKDHSYERSGPVLDPGPIDCSEVTTDEARDLHAILSGVRLEDAEGDEITVWSTMLLPHGEWITQGG